MTRTERNQYPAAVLKDRHSRAGLNKNELQRKQGAGAHNWGSFAQEGQYEDQADADVRLESTDVFDMAPQTGDANADAGDMADLPHDDLGGSDMTNGAADETGIRPDVPKNSNRETVIATSPTDSMSSLDSAGARGGRRMSNVSEEERERARLYREGALHKNGVDLTHIARTSYGIAQSPPSGNTFGTSPTKTKSFDLK